jgi:hypothetical protein
METNEPTITITIPRDLATYFINEVADVVDFIDIQNETLPEEDNAIVLSILEVRDAIQATLDANPIEVSA